MKDINGTELFEGDRVVVALSHNGVAIIGTGTITNIWDGGNWEVTVDGLESEECGVKMPYVTTIRESNCIKAGIDFATIDKAIDEADETRQVLLDRLVSYSDQEKVHEIGQALARIQLVIETLKTIRNS